MKYVSIIHQVTYTLTIRSDRSELGPPAFRGALATVAGQKFEFNTLAELNSLLCEVGGWVDTTPEPKEGGDANPSDKAIEATRCSHKSDESDLLLDGDLEEEEK